MARSEQPPRGRIDTESAGFGSCGRFAQHPDMMPCAPVTRHTGEPQPR